MTPKLTKKPDHSTGATWLSISDLMASLVFLFIVILGVFSIQFKKEHLNLIREKKTLEQPLITKRAILDQLKKQLSSKGLEVEIHQEEGILRLTENTLGFEEAMATPRPRHTSHLMHLAKALDDVLRCVSITPTPSKLKCPDTYKGRVETVMIEGHTDALPINQRAGYLDNLALSAARATTVFRQLQHMVPGLKRYRNSRGSPLFAASGYSSLRPITSNPRDPRNRRIDIRLVMESANPSNDSRGY